MRVVCACGNPMSLSSTEPRNCVKCGTACCSACAFALVTATYCPRCAESVLDAEGIPLRLSQVAPRADALVDSAWPPRRGADPPQWLILVARDQPDLYGHLVRAFSRDDKVQILLDRRKDYTRNPPGLEERLRTHGAAVIRRRS